MLDASWYGWLYLMLAITPCLACLGIWLHKRYLGRHILVAGIIGAFWEAGSEIFYLTDYWHPVALLGWPTFRGQHWPILEDAIYGFGVTGFMAVLIPYVSNRTYVPYMEKHPVPGLALAMRPFYVAYVFLALMWMGSMRLATLGHGINSIWLASALFLGIGLQCLWFRPKLWRAGLLAAATFALIALVFYAIALNLMVDGNHYLAQVWLPYHQWFGWRILGVPVDEIVWNAARGWGVAIAYPVLASLQFGQPAPTPR